MKQFTIIVSGLMLSVASITNLCAQNAEVIGYVPGPVHITYQHGRNHVVGSSYFYNRTWWNHDYWAIDVNTRPTSVTNFLSDNVQRFGNLTSYQRGGDDGYAVATPTRNLPSGFQQDWVYAVYVDRSNPSTPTTRIAQFNPDGTSANANWYNFDNNSYYIRLAFDEVGTFGYNLISSQFASGTTEIRRHDSLGNTTTIATLNQRLPSLFVVPNNPARYGPLAGKLMSVPGDIITVDATGNVQTWGSIDRNVATISIAVGNVIYLADWASNSIIELRAPILDNYQGEIIGFIYDARAPGSGIARIYWDAASQSVRWDMILYFRDYGLIPKGATAVVVPEISSLSAFALLSGLGCCVFRRRNRRCSS